jgi:hypothetical protein
MGRSANHRAGQGGKRGGPGGQDVGALTPVWVLAKMVLLSTQSQAACTTRHETLLTDTEIQPKFGSSSVGLCRFGLCELGADDWQS